MPTTTTGGPSNGWEKPAYEGGEPPAQEAEDVPEVDEPVAEAEAPRKTAAKRRKAS